MKNIVEKLLTCLSLRMRNITSPIYQKHFPKKNCSNKGCVLSTDKCNYAKQYFLFREQLVLFNIFFTILFPGLRKFVNINYKLIWKLRMGIISVFQRRKYERRTLLIIVMMLRQSYVLIEKVRCKIHFFPETNGKKITSRPLT